MDVDAIAEITLYPQFGDRLRRLGFNEDVRVQLLPRVTSDRFDRESRLPGGVAKTLIVTDE